jgi:hypothetical protein
MKSFFINFGVVKESATTIENIRRLPRFNVYELNEWPYIDI